MPFEDLDAQYVRVRGGKAVPTLCITAVGAGFFYVFAKCIELRSGWGAASAVLALVVLIGALLRVNRGAPDKAEGADPPQPGDLA